MNARCQGCRGLGFGLFNGTDLQACDSCGRYAYDDEAAMAADLFIARYAAREVARRAERARAARRRRRGVR